MKAIKKYLILLIIIFSPIIKLSANERDIVVKQENSRHTKPLNRWAVVIGISKYQDNRIDLENPIKFADKDAKAFYDFLNSPKGGGFDKEHILLLTNEEATLFAIKRAFNHFLAKAKEEDLVIIYFAGHGASEPDEPSNLFLLPYDTNTDLMRATAYPMDEINLILQKYIKAKRVVVIADACHSGGIKMQLARRGLEKNLINRYLNQLTKSREGVVTITASRIAQLSQEGENWGSGHGVFTHFLLKGLEGEADGYLGDKNGIVTVAEAYEYTRVAVSNATNNAQIPDSGGSDIDIEIPLGVLENNNNIDKEQISLKSLEEMQKNLEAEKKKLAEERQAFEEEHASKQNQSVKVIENKNKKTQDEKQTQDLEKDMEDAKNKIKEKMQEPEKPEEPLGIYIGVGYQDEMRFVKLDNDEVIEANNKKALVKLDIAAKKVFNPYVLLLIAPKTTIGDREGTTLGKTYFGGGLNLNFFRDSFVSWSIGGEYYKFENSSDNGINTRNIEWEQSEVNTKIYIGKPESHRLYLGAAGTKINGSIKYTNGGDYDYKIKEALDPLTAFIGAKLVFGYFQLDGEYRVTDMVEGKKHGASIHNTFSVAMGAKF